MRRFYWRINIVFKISRWQKFIWSMMNKILVVSFEKWWWWSLKDELGAWDQESSVLQEFATLGGHGWRAVVVVEPSSTLFSRCDCEDETIWRWNGRSKTVCGAVTIVTEEGASVDRSHIRNVDGEESSSFDSIAWGSNRLNDVPMGISGRAAINWIPDQGACGRCQRGRRIGSRTCSRDGDCTRSCGGCDDQSLKHCFGIGDRLNCAESGALDCERVTNIQRDRKVSSLNGAAVRPWNDWGQGSWNAKSINKIFQSRKPVRSSLQILTILAQ